MKYLSNTIYLLLDRTLAIFLAVIVASVIARSVTNEQFGEYSLVINTFQMFGFVALLGLETTVTREIIDRPALETTILSNTLILRIIGSIFAFVLFNSYVILFLDGNKWFLFYSITYFFQIFMFLEYCYIAKERALDLLWLKGPCLFVFSVLKVSLVYTFNEIYLVLILDSILFLLLSILFLRNGLWGAKWVFKQVVLKEMRRLFKKSYLIIISSFFILIFSKADQMMISAMVGLKENSIYAASSLISNGIFFLPIVISSALYPLMIKSKERNSLDKIYRLKSEVINLTCYIVAFIGFVFSENIIMIIYGDQYVESIIVFEIQFFSIIFAGLGVSSNKWLILQNKHKYLIVRTIYAALFNILFNYLLIPLYGACGAAVSTLIAHAISGFFANSINRNTRELFVMQIKSLIPILAMKYLYEKAFKSTG